MTPKSGLASAIRGRFHFHLAVPCRKQGFGRLIRTKTDQGIVAILDPRVLTKPYGKTFLNSLPECPRIVDQHDFSRPPV